MDHGSAQSNYQKALLAQVGQTFSFAAPAKLNLRLKFTGRRADGFHLLSALNCSLELADQIEFTVNKSEKLTLSTEGAELGESDDNLVIKAVTEFFKTYQISKVGLDIKLKKLIPVAAGLGGGSTDAAAMLRALGKLVELGPEKLMPSAEKLGSDVPYALIGGFAHVSGVGEKVLKVPVIEGAMKKLVLVIPDCPVPTVEAYKLVRERYQDLENLRDKKMEALLVEGALKWEQILTLIHNDFEPLIRESFFEIDNTFQILEKVPDAVCSLSGSGSAIFVIPKDSREDILSEEIQKELEAKECTVLETEIL